MDLPHEKIRFMRPFLPPRQELDFYLERIWNSRQLTNNGPIHQEFEKALCSYLGVDYISLFANGTLALYFALKSLQMKGEVITTPFTSVATLQAICRNNLKPVFVDIDPDDLNIHPEKIEAAITSETVAVVPVHLFGTPCDIKHIQAISDQYQLSVVYDAAHCFGVKSYGTSVCNYGDYSVLSFHATKVFNTFEGGAVICHNNTTKEYLDAMKSHSVEKGIDNALGGMNAKMNEIQAALGIVNLNHIDEVIALRAKASHLYRDQLEGIKGIRFINIKESTKSNFSYMPVIINSDELGISRDKLAIKLKEQGIISRKYFFPLVCDFPEFRQYKDKELPQAQLVAQRILCLPLYHDISETEIITVTEAIRQIYNHA